MWTVAMPEQLQETAAKIFFGDIYDVMPPCNTPFWVKRANLMSQCM